MGSDDPELFARAAEARATDGAAFDRAALIAVAATRHGCSSDRVEQALYADLRSEHVLTELATFTPEQLVARWEEAMCAAAVLVSVLTPCNPPG